jgi:hypothetical protein
MYQELRQIANFDSGHIGLNWNRLASNMSLHVSAKPQFGKSWNPKWRESWSRVNRCGTLYIIASHQQMVSGESRWSWNWTILEDTIWIAQVDIMYWLWLHIPRLLKHPILYSWWFWSVNSDKLGRRTHRVVDMCANPSHNTLPFITLASREAYVKRRSSKRIPIEGIQRTKCSVHDIRSNDSAPIQGKKEGSARRERNWSSNHLLPLSFTSHPDHFMLTSLHWCP